MENKYILWFDEVNKNDVSQVGGKGANLGEMCEAGIPVPYGFIVSSKAYFDFIQETNLYQKIRKHIETLNYEDPNNLAEVSGHIQKDIVKTPIPKKIAREIMMAYLDLASRAKKSSKIVNKLVNLLKHPFVAVRSSATAEDLPTASFAGQQATYLNIKGEANVVAKVREAWASLFTARAIFYRQEYKFDHMSVGIAVPVQLMVDSHTSGVMFTVDPLTNCKKKVVIEAIYGLGELIVQGEVTPDHYEVDKKTFQIIGKKIVKQTEKLIKKQGKNTIVKVSDRLSQKQKISDKEIVELAKIGVKLEKHYYFPQDIEWAIERGNVYIVQTRPVTTTKERKAESGKREEKDLTLSTSRLTLLLTGDPASPGIASGPVKVILSASCINQVKPGDVLVTTSTNPDFVPAMKKASAIVTEYGGRTSHAAIVSRELGIPAIVGAEKATQKLKTSLVVTVNGSSGVIYKGAPSKVQSLKFKVQSKEIRKSKLLKTATKIYVNLATPDRVTEVAKMNCDGVGLLRAEFMIADIGIHPKKLIKEKKQKFFITRLAQDLSKFCQAFLERPVVYRATDFKTNEYRNLKGGDEFEPKEENPMLGFRGAKRYVADPQVFNLELEAIKLVRNNYKHKNLWLMIPFVRTVKELEDVKKIISASNLYRSASFKLWMMVEVPSNVILIDKFCQVGIDGVSIGSNDLTQLILGVDRDNTELVHEFDERDEAVLYAIKKVIATAGKYGVTSSICGQAPSDYPELVEKLVKWGITSISVNPDALYHVRETVYEAEKTLVKNKKRT